LLTDNAASPASPGTLHWKLSTDPTWGSASDGWRQGLFVGAGKTMYVALTPKAQVGSASDMGSVATDYVEVTVRYRLP